MSDKKAATKTSSSVDQAIDKQRTSDIDQTAREAERDTKTLKPGQSNASPNNRRNNGRGGGK